MVIFMPDICLKVTGWEGGYNANDRTLAERWQLLTLNDREYKAHYTSILFFNKTIYLYLCAYSSVCMSLMCKYPWRPEENVQSLREFGSSGRAVHILNSWVIASVLYFYFAMLKDFPFSCFSVFDNTHS